MDPDRPHGPTVTASTDQSPIHNGLLPVLVSSGGQAYSCAIGSLEDTTLTRPAHPSPERLANLAEGLLGALERSRLEHHISECSRCSAELRALTAPSNLPKPASGGGQGGVLARARGFLPRRSSPPSGQRFVGVLRFDSARMPPAFGMRGSLDGPSRQLLFEAGPFEIELHISAGGGGWSLSGQVLGPTDAASGEVRLVGPRHSAGSTLSELLEFTLPIVAAGTYRLEIQLPPDAVLLVDSLELGS